MNDKSAKVSIRRRLAAICYDWILCSACLILFSGLIVSLNRGEFVAGTQLFFFRLALLAIIFFYFVGFWSHGGQTPGMKVWKIRLTADQPPANLTKLLLRFLLAFFSFGLVILWGGFRADRKGLHDIISQTTLRRVL